MIKIILASHGPIAEAMVESSKMLYGEVENVAVVCLYPQDSVHDFATKLRSEIKSNEEVLLLVDIPGGTPSNQGMMLLPEYPHLRIVSGLNLMMFLETLMQRDTMNVDELVVVITQTGKDSIKEMALNMSDDELDALLD